MLTPIRAAGDDLTVLRRIRAAFDPRSFHTALTELTIAMLAVHGPATLDQLAAQVYPHLGHNWQLTRRRLSEPDVRYAIVEQSSFMAGLDLLDNSNRHAWTLDPSARTLLPGVTILIDYFAATA